MGNIIRIILRDFKAVTTNVVAMVIVMGLCVIPSLYAWFNINSNWDPYGEESTSNLHIAVFSKDEGIEVKGMQVAIGDSVVEALHENKTIGWIFPEDERTTVNGVYSGEYYAAMVIPEDFTESIAGIVDGRLDGGRILYYENDKKNAIATKITGKAKTAVQNQVNSTVFRTITEMSAKLGSALGSQEPDSGVEKILLRIEAVKQDIRGYQRAIGTLKTLTDATIETTTGLAELNEKLVNDLQADVGLLSTASMAFGTSGIETANVRLKDYISLLTDGRTDLKQTKKLLKELYAGVERLETELYGVKDSELLQQALEILQNEPEKIGEFFATPVNLETEAVYPIKNYGSQMAPFYTVLALWFGALTLVAIIHTKVHPFEGLKNPRHYQEYFGRYAVYFILGQLQTVICVLGDLFFMEIQCRHMFLFWLAGALASFVFTFMIYSLTYAFGNVGEALAVILLVIQVAGAGGTFPKEVLPDVFQMIYKFLPFTYVMDAFKEAVGGVYQNDYGNCMLSLAAFLPVCLVIGLVGSIPVRSMNRIIERSKEKTKLMI